MHVCEDCYNHILEEENKKEEELRTLNRQVTKKRGRKKKDE